MRVVRKLPTLEAYQWNGTFEDAPTWVLEMIENHKIVIDYHVKDKIAISTPKGGDICRIHDYIIQKEDGNLISCSSSIFPSMYDIVEE